ncbi:hypothetical protein BH20ACI3_BH20ACI3_22210 [soil metagenome]
MPSIILMVVIASLCFSIGEGLRLTPFPISNLTRAEAANVLLGVRVSDQNSLSKYGPLDVPTLTQKRNKRQALDLAGPPTLSSREIPNYFRRTAANEPIDIISSLLVSRPAGRAPPFVT